MKVHTELLAKYGKARMVGRYNPETKKPIDYKIYDADRHVVLTTNDYNEADNFLMNGNIKR